MDKDKVLKIGKRLLKILAWVVGIFAAIIIIVQIVLSPAVLTRIVNNMAEDYIDGDLKFGKASVSMFRHFPNVSVSLDSVTLTYPTERYAAYETGAHMLKAGKGEAMDTLAAFDRFTAAVNVPALITGNIKLPFIELGGPRIFAKNYKDGVANWNIFKTGDSEEDTEEEADTVATGGSMPKITIERVFLGERPVIVYCSKPDTLYASVILKEMEFDGRLSTASLHRTRINFEMDSLFVAGRMGKDTVAVGLDLLGIRQHRKSFGLKLEAKAAVATRAFGRMRIPIGVEGRFTLPKDTVPAISIRKLKAEVAGIPLKADADVRYLTDSIWVKANASIDDCKVSEVIDYCGKNFWEGAADLKTDATINMTANVDGWYNMDGSRLPAIDLTFSIPDSPLKYEKFRINTNIGLDLWAKGGADDPINVGIDDLHLRGDALKVNLQGSADDLLGRDPLLKVDGDLSIVVDSLAGILESQLGMLAQGTVSAKAKGTVNMSQLEDPYKMATADIVAFLKTDRLEAVSAQDSLDLHIDSLSIVVGALENQRDTTIEQGLRLLTAGARIDSTFVRYKEAFTVRGKSLAMHLWSDAAVIDPSDSSAYYPLSGRLDIGRLSLMDSDSSRVSLRGSETSFKVTPSADDKDVPVVTLKSSNENLRGKVAFNRLSVRDLNLNLTASQNDIKRKKRAKAFIDSVARANPDVPRDSLLQFLRNERMAAGASAGNGGPGMGGAGGPEGGAGGPGTGGPEGNGGAGAAMAGAQRELPDWLTEEDFKKSDLNLKLDDAMAKYYREWDFDGSLTMKRANLMTPLMPLRNSVNDLDAHIDNNTLTLNNLTVKSGNSNLTASGTLTGLRRALLSGGPMRLSMYFNSDSLNVNELLAAYDKGAQLSAHLDSLNVDVDSMEDDDYTDMIAIDTLADAEAPTKLLVVPANLIADITLDAADVKYAILEMDAIHTEITMKERCIQAVNTIANSNVGGLSLEGFYSTKTKDDLSAGFNLNLSEITADKVIEMIPAIDTLMPVLKSFYGQLNVEIAATTQIDTMMNIVLPSLNGVMRIQGHDVTLAESEDLYKIAKTLKFKNKEVINIDEMSVEALISDSKVEIFPFVLDIDRYSLAMSGIQNLDQSYSYHISVLKWPLIIRFGINLRGNDFDKMKFRIGKAKYKSKNVPVFSSVIDETKLSLSEAIQNIFSKGVSSAIAENRKNTAIEEKKKELGYVNPAEEEMEELSSEETLLLESADEETAEEAAGDDAAEAAGDAAEEAAEETADDAADEPAEETEE